MKIIYLSLPAIILMDIYAWTWVAGLLTAPSDLAVFSGIVSIFVIIILHYAFYKLLKFKF
ncbi:hypothetical protein SAMN05428949_5164 [Chitinophaga sp. YR627]|uniref:hypothetical protein n=1 Tax=Chitinophaga sp. YR627 TaxID=1881041 RepID=UPI0008F37C37|nr:hypothetical protein [Chitinophaga sp. YR627]SFO44617.1 hypothetical protein SAMN05428949_5164 [Chitinophaga sp. YR627]